MLMFDIYECHNFFGINTVKLQNLFYDLRHVSLLIPVAQNRRSDHIATT